MTEKEKFDIILSKNRLAKNIKYMLNQIGVKESQILLYDLEQIEKLTGTANQPTVKEIFESKEIN